MQSLDASCALNALLEIPGYEVETGRFERSFNLTTEAAEALYRTSKAVRMGPGSAIALPANRVAAFHARMLTELEAHHRTHPEAEGLTPRDLKAQIPEPISPAAFQALQRDMIEQRLIVVSGQFLKRTGHVAQVSEADLVLWRKVLPWLQDRGAQPFTLTELATELRTSEPVVRALVYGRRSNGEVWRITPERFLLREQVAALAASAAALADAVGGKGFTAAQYRDATGVGRNRTIEILEFFDSIGVTYRNGDMRRVRSDFEQVVGHAEAVATNA
jgi:selenocysteine-specific elongation factor